MALTTAFARNGNRKAVPQTTQDGSVSYDQGFGAFYALPPEEGGLFIDRAQFNQIMYDTTSAVISNQNSINSLNSSVNTLNTKVADIEGGVATGVVNLTTNQTIGGVKTFSVPPVSATNPSNNNQIANKAYVDSVGNTAVKLTGNQTIAGVKTFSSPVVVPNGTANTHAVNLSQLNTKANANATVNLTGNQSIAGVKTFSSPPVSATNPSNNNQVANKAYVDTVGNTAVKLTGAQNIAGAKTFTSNITAPNITTIQNNLNTIFNSTTKPVVSQTTTKVITVGTGGDFPDLLSAINEARKYTSAIRIELVSNLKARSDIRISFLNGMNIELLFNGFKIINEDTSIHKFMLNVAKIGIISELSLDGFELMLVFHASTSLVGNVTIDNSRYPVADCITVATGSILAAAHTIEITLSHKGQRMGIRALFGGIVGLSANSRIIDNSTDGRTLHVYGGGIISLSADGISIDSSISKANQAANTLTASGIIFGNYSL